MSWLKDRFEELSAQLNFRDGGKTAATVRAARQSAPPVQTVRQPANQPPSYGGGIGGFVNRVKDNFVDNSPQDVWRNNQLKLSQDNVDTVNKIYRQQKMKDLKSNLDQGKITPESYSQAVRGVLDIKTPTSFEDYGYRKVGNQYVDSTKQSKAQDVLQGLGTGVMAAAPQRTVGGALEFGGKLLGNEAVEKKGNELIQPFRDYNQNAYETSGNKALYTGGNVVGGLLTLPVAPQGKVGMAVRAAQYGLPAAADTAHAIEQGGGSANQQKVGGAAVGGLSAALATVGAEKILGAGNRAAGSVWKTLAQSALSEGGEEGVQQFVDNLVAKNTYDKGRSLLENVPQAVGIGVTGGTVAGGSVAASGRMRPTTNLVSGLDPQTQQRRNDLANAYTSASDSGRAGRAAFIDSQIRKIDNPKPTTRLVSGVKRLTQDQRGSIQLPGKKSDPLEALKAEARKYKSADEFVNSQIKNTYLSKYGDGALNPMELPSLHQSNIYANKAPNGADLEVYSMRNVDNFRHLSGKSEYNSNTRQLKTYRVVPSSGESVQPGDFVFDNKAAAEKYLLEHPERGNKIVSVSGSFDDFLSPEAIQSRVETPSKTGELIYAPKSKRGILTDLYNQATKPKRPSLWSDEAGAIGRNIRDEGSQGKEIKTRTIKTAEGKTEYVAQLGDTVKDRVGRSTGFKATQTSPNFKTEGEMNKWIKEKTDPTRIKMDEAFKEINEQAGKTGVVDAKKWREVNKLADDYWKSKESAPQAGIKPKGFILKETRGRGGRKDTVRVKKGADGKLEKTYQTEFDTKSADPYIKEYADSLKQMESGLRGGDMIPDGEGGYKRTSEHSNFYREHFKQTGRKPTRADWYAEAERQVKAGTADKDFMEYYNAKITERGTAPDNAKVLENKAPRRMSEQEWASLTKQAGLEAPKSKGAVNSATESLKKEQLNAVSQGDFKRAQEIRTKIGEVEQGLKRTPPDLSKRAEEITPDLEVKDIKGRSNKEVKKQYMQRANDYLGERRAAEFKAVDEARRFNQQFPDLTDTQRLEVIRAADQPSYKSSDPQVQAAVEYLHTNFDSLYNYFTGERGVNMGYQHSYYPRMYKNPTTGELLRGAEFELLQRGSARQKGRTADIVNEDYLITKDPAEALQMYVSNLENAAAGKKFLSDLEKDGLVVRSTEPVRGMRPVVAEGMQESGTIFYAKPEVAKSLDRMFGTQEASGAFEKLVEKAQGVNSFMQSVVLSGGIPNTPVNAFGFMQVMKEVMAGHPVVAGKAFVKSLGRKNTDQFFKARSETIQEMVKNGYDLRIDYNAKYRNMFKRVGEVGGEKGKLAGINEAWDQFTNDATFQRFMPMMEVMHYEQIKKGLIRRGTSPEVAAKRAMDATSNYFGKTSMAKQASRNKVGQDFVGATLFAPRFRESMINFWGRNIKALNPKNIGKVEYRSNQMFMVSAAATWAAMEGINMALNGNWMHDNPDGKKDKLLIPDKVVPWDTGGKDVGVPFLSSISTVPRNAAMGAYNLATGKFDEAGKNAKSFASMPLNAVMSLATNEDYFGNKIVDDDANSGQKFTQAASYLARNNMQPWVREAVNAGGQKLPSDVKKALGVKKKTPFEAISNAFEAPTRFYDPKYYKFDDKWTPRGAPGEKFTINEQRDRARIKAEQDAIPNKLGLSKKQKESYEALTAVDFDDQGNLKTDNDPFYRAKRATALQDDGVFEAMKQRAKYNKKLKGQPIDPLFNLPADARRVILWKQTLPAGTKDPTISQIYNQQWYQDFRGEQDKYYREKQVWNKKMGYKSTKDKHPYPQPSKQLQAKLDYYYTLPKGTGARSAMLRANPDILKHWDRTEAWTNGERAMVGLGPLEEQTGFGSYASSGSGRSYSRSGRSGGSRGGGRRAANFDYTKNLFDSSRGGSKATTASLRKILEEAMADFKTKA